MNLQSFATPTCDYYESRYYRMQPCFQISFLLYAALLTCGTREGRSDREREGGRAGGIERETERGIEGGREGEREAKMETRTNQYIHIHTLSRSRELARARAHTHTHTQ